MGSTSLSGDFPDLRFFLIRLIELRQIAVDVRLGLLYPQLHALTGEVFVSAVDRLEFAAIYRHQRR